MRLHHCIEMYVVGLAHHKVTKDNSNSASSKVNITLHKCANVQPRATATFKQPKLLDGLQSTKEISNHYSIC